MDTLSSILGIIGFAIGLVGLVSGIVFYLHGRRVYRVQFDTVQQEIIRESLDLPALRLMFGQKRIHSLRIADIAIVNTGSEIIRGSEHTTANPLVINLPDAEIYGAELVHASRGECLFDIEKVSRSGYEVSFDFMDPTDGCVARFFIGGPSTARIDVSGTFQSARDITRYRPDAVRKYLGYTKWGLAGLFATATVAALTIALAAPDSADWRMPLVAASAAIAVASLLSVNIAASRRVADMIRAALRITSEDRYSAIAFLKRRELPSLAPDRSRGARSRAA